MPGPEFDAFGDVINTADGIFGATEPNIAGTIGGLRAHDSVKTVATPQGVAVEMQCRGCPNPLRITVEWPELVAISYNLAPQDFFGRVPGLVQQVTLWHYSQDMWWPECRCGRCGNIAGPMFTHEEAGKLLDEGQRKGWILQEGRAYLSNLVYQIIQQRAGKPIALPAGR